MEVEIGEEARVNRLCLVSPPEHSCTACGARGDTPAAAPGHTPSSARPRTPGRPPHGSLQTWADGAGRPRTQEGPRGPRAGAGGRQR